MIKRSLRAILRTLAVSACLSVSSPVVFADIQKFVYAYNSKAELLTPKNAADKCPDPAGDHRAATSCKGVLVDENGEYSLRFANGKVDKNNLVLVANEYEFIPASEQGVSEDTYVLLDAKRRVDKVRQGERNDGVDINNLSEACVRAVESEHDLPKGKKGHVHAELADSADKVDAEKLNRSLANDKSDNKHNDVDDQHERDRRAVREQRLSEQEQETLVELAKASLKHQEDDDTQSYVRRSVMQFLHEPARTAHTTGYV